MNVTVCYQKEDIIFCQKKWSNNLTNFLLFLKSDKMEQDQPPFAIQLQRREMTLSQRNRPHPYLNSPNSGTYESRIQEIEPILF